MKKLVISILLISISTTGISQKVNKKDSTVIKQIFDTSLTNGASYEWLDYMSNNIGSRLSGSLGAELAVVFTKEQMEELGIDKVWLQPVMVPKWTRGAQEYSYIETSPGVTSLASICALGGSVPTPYGGLKAAVVEVKSFEELRSLGREIIEGKIVFYNRPMDPTQLRTFNAYGGAVDQRGSGSSKAAEYGAVGVLVRSMTTRLDDVPHTGALGYKDGVKKIPAVAISTNDAEVLSRVLKKEKTHIYMRTTCEMLANKLSYNVIGEIRGSEKPDEIILVGGHLDSWDIGSGAHDDGAGCVHSMDVLQILKRLNYEPLRTIRCVLFMNEENGLAGGKAYAKASNDRGEYHLAAIESDAGGFTPRGFSSTAHPDVFKPKFKKMTEWLPLLEPYGLEFRTGGSGADITPLKSQKGLLNWFLLSGKQTYMPCVHCTKHCTVHTIVH